MITTCSSEYTVLFNIPVYRETAEKLLLVCKGVIAFRRPRYPVETAPKKNGEVKGGVRCIHSS
jgi:hypothetical protein